ncbi:MAG: cytochrome c oxidase subunit II, partial [Limisphaerales bacterium]
MENFITKILFLPPVVSAHGPQVDRLLFYVHALMFLLALGWGVFFFFTLWRFRQRRAAQADPVGVRSHVS